MSISYPQLDPDPEVAAPFAPPVDDEEAERYHECGVCGDRVQTDKAHTVLDCRHTVHFACTRGLFRRAREMPESIGGVNWCSVCRKNASAGGGWDANADPSLADDRIIQTLNAMHAKRFKRDVFFELQNGQPSLELEQKLLGPSGLGKRMASVVGSLTESVKLTGQSLNVWNAEDPVPDDGEEPECYPSTIAERMVAAKRTLDRVFQTSDADIADLYNAGLSSIEALRKVGFSVGLHLTEPYRRRLPVFALASHLGLCWDHIKDLSPKTVRSFKLSAAEFRLLRCEVPDLIKARWTARDVLHLGIAPSKLVKYMGLQVAHLNALGITLPVFAEVERWKRDFDKKDSAFRALVLET